MKKLYVILKAALGGFLGVFFGHDNVHLLGLPRPPRTVCAAICTVVSEYTDSCGVYHSGLRDAGTGTMDLAKENVIL